MTSRNIEDHKDIGLNADWCVSTYQMDDNHFIFDSEIQDKNGQWIYELYHIENPEDCHEEDYTLLGKGSFSECVDCYEKQKGGESC